MPISYVIDAENRTVRTTATGVLTGAELIGLKKKLLEDPRFRPAMRELSDIRGITELKVTSADVGQLVAIDERHADRLAAHELALLAGSDLSFGMARMYQLRADRPGKVAVFRSEAEAEAWLTRPPDGEPDV